MNNINYDGLKKKNHYFGLTLGYNYSSFKIEHKSIKWSQTRYQFQAPLAKQELVRQRVARMSAYVYAMDAVLYMTTGMLDRKDEDIQVETALCKVFNSEWGWRTVNDALQIMGGEGYMTENELERIFRDSRINLIVEGANEVMQSYIFAYGGKQLAERLLGIKEKLMREEGESLIGFIGKAARNSLRPKIMGAAIPTGTEVFLGMRRRPTRLARVSGELAPIGERLTRLASELTYQFKVMSKKMDAKIVERQAVQARLADIAILLHAWACTLARLDADLRAHGSNGASDLEWARDRAAAMHFFDLAEVEIGQKLRELYENADDTMFAAADAALKYSDAREPGEFIIPEKSPTPQRGHGSVPKQEGIKQFPGESWKGAALDSDVGSGAKATGAAGTGVPPMVM